MKSKKEQKPKGHKPERKNKSRLLFVGFIAMAVIWGIFH